jgi:hypothetical protein
MAKIGDYDRWFKPCEKCGYDTAKAAESSKARCWKCGNRIHRDYSERALKANARVW